MSENIADESACSADILIFCLSTVLVIYFLDVFDIADHKGKRKIICADVYAVLEEIFEKELSKGVKEYNDTSSWEEAFLRSSNFAFENRKAINHIYHSIQREQLERYLYSIAGDVMNRYVNRINENIGADKEDVEIIAYFYQCALTQMVLKWIEKGIQDNAEELIRKTGKIFDGNIEMMLKKRKSGNS